MTRPSFNPLRFTRTETSGWVGVWDPLGIVLLQCQLKTKAKEFDKTMQKSHNIIHQRFNTTSPKAHAELEKMQKEFEEKARKEQQRVSKEIESLIEAQLEPLLLLWKQRVFWMQLALVGYTAFFFFNRVNLKIRVM